MVDNSATMTTDPSSSATSTEEFPAPRIPLVYLFYAMASFCAGLAMFGEAGFALSCLVAGFWMTIFFSASRPRTLLRWLAVILVLTLAYLLFPLNVALTPFDSYY